MDYTPSSSKKDEGVLIPVNMREPLQQAMADLEGAVGDTDEYAAKELGYKDTKELHDALMGLQVDSVAAAIYQMKQGTGAPGSGKTSSIAKSRNAGIVSEAMMDHFEKSVAASSRLSTPGLRPGSDLSSLTIHAPICGAP